LQEETGLPETTVRRVEEDLIVLGLAEHRKDSNRWLVRSSEITRGYWTVPGDAHDGARRGRAHPCVQLERGPAAGAIDCGDCGDCVERVFDDPGDAGGNLVTIYVDGYYRGCVAHGFVAQGLIDGGYGRPGYGQDDENKARVTVPTLRLELHQDGIAVMCDWTDDQDEVVCRYLDARPELERLVHALIELAERARA
jgi:hypothetical protein